MASACSRREGTQSFTMAPYQFQGEHDGVLSMNWLTIRIPLHVTGVDAAPHTSNRNDAGASPRVELAYSWHINMC